MIPGRSRDVKRRRISKMPKNIERLYKEGKCCDCSVVVTRMDFAKILGKFTKVKIQYESTNSPKTKTDSQKPLPKANARLKSNENGMVLIHRTAYKPHPVKNLVNPKSNKTLSPVRQANNILKERNLLKKTPLKTNNFICVKNNIKQYGIIFTNPVTNNKHDVKNNISLLDLIPLIDKNILPNENWSIDYLPKLDEPRDDKVYERIAAELEDLMYNEKKIDDKKVEDEKSSEEFPSIMDILNEKPNLQSEKDSETSPETKESAPENTTSEQQDENNKDSPMDVDTTDLKKLLQDVNVVANEDGDSKVVKKIHPQSPSILDEALQKGIEEHLPVIDSSKTNNIMENSDQPIEDTKPDKSDLNEKCENQAKDQENKDKNTTLLSDNVTHVIFRKTIDGKCYKCVICPKNLKYSIELDGKEVEFLGAPKYISSLDDMKVLLQIVNESELDSLYVLC